ncbi:hypothetical protein ACIQZO_31385 [Streptomyces sp. NPDC097617]|uniref:hypothetical protein n=1 Tax=Streptomyces sp. NPDC097617 TaxID=3366091 RepID=UPI003810A0C5
MERGDDLFGALRRELAEELDLDVGRADGGELLWLWVSCLPSGSHAAAAQAPPGPSLSYPS